MIRFILLQNWQGKTRLAKYYIPLEDSEKHKVEYELPLLASTSLPRELTRLGVPVMSMVQQMPENKSHVVLLYDWVQMILAPLVQYLKVSSPQTLWLKFVAIYGNGEDDLVQLAVGQCPRKCIYYVMPSFFIVAISFSTH